PFARTRRARRMHGPKQEHDPKRGEADTLEDAERARLDAEPELHEQCIAQQCGAAGKAQQELTAERPAERIHRRALVGFPDYGAAAAKTKNPGCPGSSNAALAMPE